MKTLLKYLRDFREFPQWAIRMSSKRRKIVTFVFPRYRDKTEPMFCACRVFSLLKWGNSPLKSFNIWAAFLSCFETFIVFFQTANFSQVQLLIAVPHQNHDLLAQSLASLLSPLPLSDSHLRAVTGSESNETQWVTVLTLWYFLSVQYVPDLGLPPGPRLFTETEITHSSSTPYIQLKMFRLAVLGLHVYHVLKVLRSLFDGGSSLQDMKALTWH